MGRLGQPVLAAAAWERDKEWADTFLPEIERVLRSASPYMVTVEIATDDDDQRHATDYVLRVSSGAVACRVRDAARCPWRDLTLRSGRDSGATTELGKILKGWADWYLYAWADGDRFIDWVLVDLGAFRCHWSALQASGTTRYAGGGTSFLAIPVAALESVPGLVVARAAAHECPAPRHG